MVKKPLWTLVFLVLTLSSALAQDGLQFSIRFFNKDIYYPESPVALLVSLKNTSDRTLWFSVPNNSLFGMNLKLRNMADGGREVVNSEKFKENRFNNQPVFFRDVTLRPGEEFSTQVDLKDWFDDLSPGVYQVQGTYYPRLIGGFQGLAEAQPAETRTDYPDRLRGAQGQEGIESNQLLLSLRPSPISSSLAQFQTHMNDHQTEILQREKLSPDEVVEAVLLARQQDQREKFFLYLNMEELYKRDPNYKRSYLQASSAERETMLADYQDMMWNQQDFLAKRPAGGPGGFEVLSTTYAKTEALVKARLRFDLGDYYEVKEYTYSLRKFGNSWEVYDYRVTNRPAETKVSNVSRPAVSPKTTGSSVHH